MFPFGDAWNVWKACYGLQESFHRMETRMFVCVGESVGGSTTDITGLELPCLFALAKNGGWGRSKTGAEFGTSALSAFQKMPF